MFSINNSLDIRICKDATDAIRQGFMYREPVFKGLKIDKIVVVANGTEEGNSTIDIVLVDEKGQKFVTLLTGALLRSIPT